jgi:aconitate hydratase
MKLNVTRKLTESHLIKGDMTPGEEISLKIDQSLTQDATGTMVMLELEAMGIDKVKTEWALICTAHNLTKLARAA